MKPLIITVLLVVLVSQGWAQKTESNDLNSKDYLLNKSKNQKTGGFVLIGVGIAVTAVGVSLIASSSEPEASLWSYGVAVGDGSFLGGTVFSMLGVTCLATGASLLSAAAKNKKKALIATAFLKTEQRSFVQHGSFMRSSFPALALKFNLSK